MHQWEELVPRLRTRQFAAPESATKTSLKIGWFSSSEAYTSRKLIIEQDSGRTALSEDNVIGFNDL